MELSHKYLLNPFSPTKTLLIDYIEQSPFSYNECFPDHSIEQQKQWQIFLPSAISPYYTMRLVCVLVMFVGTNTRETREKREKNSNDSRF